MRVMSEKDKNMKTIKDEAVMEKIYQALEQVIDPELGIDIVNLGLINEINLYEGISVEVKMTLTTMGCPFADQIQENVKKAIIDLAEIKEVVVKLVWYPAWTPERMSRYARIALGVR